MRLTQFQKKARELAEKNPEDENMQFLWTQLKAEATEKRNEYKRWKNIEFALLNYEARKNE